MDDLQALGELGKGLTRQQQYIKSLEKSNKDLLELSLIHIELIATLERDKASLLDQVSCLHKEAD